jgi:glutathione S-transferase
MLTRCGNCLNAVFMHPYAVVCREDYPFGQLPVLEVTEGDKTVVLAQSNSIMRYIGRLGQHGIYPADPLAACQCDEVRACMFSNCVS